MLWRCSNKFNFHKEQNCRSSRQTHRGRPGVVSVCHVAGWTWTVDPHRKLNQKSSPFEMHFKKTKDLALSEITEEGIENDYWSPEILKVFEMCMYLYPVWSGSMLKREGITRDTNVDVENWFGVVKNTILQKKKNINAGLFIRKFTFKLKEEQQSFLYLCIRRRQQRKILKI